MIVIAWAVGGLVVALLLAHVAFPRVHPSQPRPENHLPGPCWACHFVSGSAPIVTE